ncbi:hypothetical protein [Yoonia maritima]|uniref:hypothetical protein n=1 Tax=Yoonia maritima TaxID=1435347 RepID=UPI000D1145C3|nr:hypothetical protein [Yoonia maritima]
MVHSGQSFEVYGFKIEVHAGGRRVWPPSFKRFVKEGLDSGKLVLADVMKECNVSQSLVYKWRADVKASRIRTTTATEDAFFSEIVVDENQPTDPLTNQTKEILLRGREIEVALPSTYPVPDLIKVILSLEGRA